MRYGSQMMAWLRDLGYTHCFFVAGGNSMHLLDGARTTMTCIPVVHEVAAGIAVEYFNDAATSTERRARAFALVTAGPGLTNIVTALAGAFLESRELLVVGGQVKTSDLARGQLRQRGIQEIDGVGLAAAVTVAAQRIENPLSPHDFAHLVMQGWGPRPGPVLVEVPLDVQGAPEVPLQPTERPATAEPLPNISSHDFEAIETRLMAAERPIVLLGGGVARRAASDAVPRLVVRGVPLMTTYNGADRVDSRERTYFGRPNTWGMRYSNVLIQQADLVLAIGTRLGLQQTGFNWQEFAPLADVVQVDIDESELYKGHPHVDMSIRADAADVVRRLAAEAPLDVSAWLDFADRVKQLLPLAESANTHGDGYLDPYEFYLDLSNTCAASDIVIPCSSGGAFTVFYQTFLQKAGQVIISDKSLASMGYGLAGATGAAFAHPGRRIVHIEGDGGFAQNMQELGTVAVNALPIKTFLFVNEGYASIRMTQRNYFGGAYVGCDARTGLGFPDWQKLAAAFGIPTTVLSADWTVNPDVLELFNGAGPAIFIVPVDPDQTYYPKVSSRVTSSGSMESNPLHLYTPDLGDDIHATVMPYLAADLP
jgi:acetolactate synthase I/II/III large subunit